MANTLKLGAGKWATGTDTVLAFNDENNNFKPLPFDFSRASSATVVNQSGLIETVGSGTPRIDFLDNTKGALKLEPQRTNLLSYSSELNIGTSGTASVSSNTTISPDGALNADTLGVGYLSKSVSAAANTYTLSVFVKVEVSSTASIYIYDGTYYSGTYDLTTGISTGVGTSMVNYGNGWWRCIITQAIASTISEIGFNSGQVYGYGLQLEAGSYPTSYIPTSGSAVTRVADACNNENLNVDYSGDYTLYLEHETFSLTEYNQFQFRQETSISYIFRVGNSINIGTNLYTTANTIGFNKFALSVTSSGSYNFYKNGVLLSSGSGLNANLETIRNDALGMSIKDIKLYNTSLTNAELQALTTI